jgi:hypothetical protein
VTTHLAVITAVASVLAAVLIIARWLWDRVSTEVERETRLLRRYGERRFRENGTVMEINQILVSMDGGVRGTLRRVFQQPTGETTVRLVFTPVDDSDAFSKTDLWTSTDFDAVLRNHDIDGSCTLDGSSTRSAAATVILETVNVETVRSVVQALNELPGGSTS